jgi:hypothetical protein
MTSSRKKNTICCICGKSPASTRDHIPPDGIFPDPKPKDLITVPACVKCNQGSSLNDEYFRAVIAIAYGNNDLAAQLVYKNIIKRFRKKPALLQSIVKSEKKVDVHSEGGIYLGKLPAIKCDPQRVCSVIDKIVRGLFWHETNEILGTDYCVSRTMFNPELPDEAKDRIRSLPIKRVGDGKVFSYRYLLDQKDHRISCWFLMFFDATLFMVFTKQNGNELGKPRTED